VGPLPEAVGLPVPDAVPTPESGGCGVELASWDRGHGSSQVQAQENTGQQPHMRLLPMEREETVQTLPRQAGASHTDAGRGPVSHRVQAQGTDTQQEWGPKSQQKSWGQP
jgi:hypothetical protein